jgi:hypothetical protein
MMFHVPRCIALLQVVMFTCVSPHSQFHRGVMARTPDFTMKQPVRGKHAWLHVVTNVALLAVLCAQMFKVGPS